MPPVQLNCPRQAFAGAQCRGWQLLSVQVKDLTLLSCVQPRYLKRPRLASSPNDFDDNAGSKEVQDELYEQLRNQMTTQIIKEEIRENIDQMKDEKVQKMIEIGEEVR